jgi:dTMP kinase
LEGIDGAGTTTQLHRLTAWLEGEGLSVYPTFEPSDGDIGQHIRKILSGEGSSHPDTVALMFAADRMEHLQTEILPRLQAGTHVLCDRYVGSSFAYQSMQSDPQWVRTINRYARKPDLTLYLHVDVDTALERLTIREGGKREIFEKRELLTVIAANYDSIYGVGGNAEIKAVVIDATQDPTKVFLDCCRVIQPFLPLE